MGAFLCLHKQSYALLRDLHRDGVISDEAYRDIEDCRSTKRLLKVLRHHFGIDIARRMEVWAYIHDKFWDWENDEYSVFNRVQSQFIVLLLQNGGIYQRSECQKIKGMTSQRIGNHVSCLEDMGIILSIKTRRKFGHRVTYILHPQLGKELCLEGNT